VVLAVNKMDLVGWDQAVFDRIVADYRAFADQIGLAVFTPSRSRAWAATTWPARARRRPGTTARS
jgi:bifunctional enzyme CysN/CysC